MRAPWWILLLVTGGCWSEPTAEPWVDQGVKEQFLGPDVLPELGLEIDPEHIAALETQPREYVPATIVYGGERFGPVGVRLKGQNSFQPIDDKPSLRLKIDEYIDGQTFFGLKDLTLNNMIDDPSQMHERLAYTVAREAWLPASMANHLRLTINGESYGLYANVETVKKRMIGSWFEDNDGTLYEATDVDFAPQYVDSYEIVSGDEDRSLIAGLATALAMPDPDAALAAASQYVDLEHFQRFWAMESVVGQFDAFPYSLPGDDYYLYADPETHKLWFLPSGMDETFFAADFSPMQTQSILAARCHESPSCFQAYVDQTWDVMAVVESIDLEGERARVEAEIAPYVADDAKRHFTDAEITEGQTQLGYFIRGRRASLGNFLPPPS